ncbi:MAG: SCO family protein [Sphingobium sp.]|nr:SCO family protein [Sphingobium sp.]
MARLRRWLWGVVIVVALAAGVALLLRQPGGSTTTQIADAKQIGEDFALTDRNGKIVTPATLRGQPYAIFFGFTRCPDVCPTTLTKVARWRKLMGKDGDKFRIVFVSVDAARDAPKDVGAYVDLFGTPILGLGGNQAQIDRATKSFGVFYQKVPLDGGDYTIDHSAAIYLMDRDGHFASAIAHDDDDAAALAELRKLIA